MKYIGIDYGSKRIGVAVSDESAFMAFPVGTIDASPKALQEVLDIMKENGAHVAVVGESRDLAGKPNPIMKEIEAFAEALQAAQVAVEFEPEFMTSQLAARQFGRQSVSRPQTRTRDAKDAEHHDASAAAIILQGYLDRMRQGGFGGEHDHTHEH